MGIDLELIVGNEAAAHFLVEVPLILVAGSPQTWRGHLVLHQDSKLPNCPIRCQAAIGEWNYITSG